MNGFSNGTAPQRDQQQDQNGRFVGKVVLLVGQQPGENHSLALRFARLGTDVAIIYRVDLVDTAVLGQQVTELKFAIEATGRRCLLLPADADLMQFPRQLVQHIVDRLGRLDFYVSRPPEQNGRSARPTNGQNGYYRPDLLPQRQLMTAAMQAILAQ